ncbi:MAG: hypothetical protein B7C24_10845 [Bacteroidetes bacterium 4572_77]|nr:MAG: hypothetical protein B7C24_10845 [Bacteroidetes bacterium 4572_77]
MRKSKTKLIFTIVLFTGLFFTNCTKENDEEPIINELELKENKLCKTWKQDYLLIDGDTTDSGPYYYHLTIEKNKDYIVSLYHVNEQGVTDDTIQYFSQWRWADHSNAIVAQYFFDIDFWMFYNIETLEEDKMILEEDTDNGVYIYSYSAISH